MHRLVWLPDALDDLDRIDLYLRQRDRAAATRVTSVIRQSARRLKQVPLSAPLEPALGIRRLSVVRYPYVILHVVGDGYFSILRVRHTAENWLPR